MQKVFSILNAILGILTALTPFILFPVCSGMKPDGTHMPCFNTGIIITVIGILILIISLLSLLMNFVKGEK